MYTRDDCLSMLRFRNRFMSLMKLHTSVLWVKNHCLCFQLLRSLDTVEWLVVDESDKLFEEGPAGKSFREQLGTVYSSCTNPRIRRAMFSATFAHDVQQWCLLNMDNVLQVMILYPILTWWRVTWNFVVGLTSDSSDSLRCSANGLWQNSIEFQGTFPVA